MEKAHTRTFAIFYLKTAVYSVSLSFVSFN